MAKAPELAPAPPAPAPAPGPVAQENNRFAPGEDIKLPEKFMRDGKPDFAAFTASYGELETRFNTKTEDLRASLMEEVTAKQREGLPEAADKYELPTIEGVDTKEMSENPLVAWWREQAFSSGIGQEGFSAGVEKYIEAITPPAIDMAAVEAGLGENHKARIAAVDAWAGKTAKTPGEMEALKGVATSADGIKLLERLAGISDPQAGDEPVVQAKGLDLATLRSMQQDKRYWSSAERDPAFVKQVDDGYAALYAQK